MRKTPTKEPISQTETLSSVMLNFLFPIRMLLRLYSLMILMIDILWMLLNTQLEIFRSILQFFCQPPLKSIRSETVLVIGAGRGVGREIAIQMAAHGAMVTCVDINEANNDKTVQTISNKGGLATGYQCDITTRDSAKQLCDKVKEDIGFISMVFYCCGIPSPRTLLTQPPASLQDTLTLTVTSYVWLIEELLPEMKAKNKGHIVALTSVAGLSHVQGHMPLSIAQFSVQGLTETLSEDLRISETTDVHVTLVHIYPFVLNLKEAPSLKLSIPSYFGTISPENAASCIIDSVRRNYEEASIPKYCLFLRHLLRLLPRRATSLIRELLDTGLDF